MPRSNVSTQKKMKEEKTVETKQIPGPRIPPPLPQTSNQTRSNSIGSGFLDSMVSGFGMGLGNSLARRIFEPQTQTQNQIPVPPPANQPSLLTPDDVFKKYHECLEHNDPSVNCESLFDTKS